MNTQDEINSLQSKIDALKNTQKNCNHIWNNTKFDPETVREGYGAGSDPHWSFVGYHDVKKVRWSRKCKKCGIVEYSNI